MAPWEGSLAGSRGGRVLQSPSHVCTRLWRMEILAAGRSSREQRWARAGPEAALRTDVGKRRTPHLPAELDIEAASEPP